MTIQTKDNVLKFLYNVIGVSRETPKVIKTSGSFCKKTILNGWDLGERPGPVRKNNKIFFQKPKCEGARVPGWEDARDHRPPVCMKTVVWKEKLARNSGCETLAAEYWQQFFLMHGHISCISFLKRILVFAFEVRCAVAPLLFLGSFWNCGAWLQHLLCHSERIGD